MAQTSQQPRFCELYYQIFFSQGTYFKIQLSIITHQLQHEVNVNFQWTTRAHGKYFQMRQFWADNKHIYHLEIDHKPKPSKTNTLPLSQWKEAQDNFECVANISMQTHPDSPSLALMYTVFATMFSISIL